MDSKWFKVKMTVLEQLQRAINDTRWWIRVLSSETIGHLKNKQKCICFINTNARLALFCDCSRRCNVRWDERHAFTFSSQSWNNPQLGQWVFTTIIIWSVTKFWNYYTLWDFFHYCSYIVQRSNLSYKYNNCCMSGNSVLLMLQKNL